MVPGSLRRRGPIASALAISTLLVSLSTAAHAALEYQPPVLYYAGASPSHIVLGDVTGDARPDAVSLPASGDQVMTLVNQGDGTFAEGLVFGVTGAIDLAVGPLDGDAFADLVVASAQDTTGSGGGPAGGLVLHVFHSNGDGTYASLADFVIGEVLRGLQLGDVDNDGDLDIVVSRTKVDPFPAHDLLVIRNDGGTFASPLSFPAALAVGLRLADLNADGNLDALLGENVSIALYGNGDGSFATPVAIGPFEGLSSVPADFDGDGDLDFAVNDETGVTLQMNDGSGQFVPGDRAMFYAYSNTLFAADLDGDGDQDVCTASYDLARVSAFRGTGSASLELPVLYFSTLSTPRVVTGADLNGDGTPDLVTTNYGYSGTMSVLIGGFFNGCGRTDVTTAPGNTMIAIADFNADGFEDVVSSTQDHRAVMMFGNGAGVFANPVSFPAGTLCQGIVAADFNGDQLPDFAVADYGESRVEVRLNLLGHDFSAASLIPTGSHPRFVSAPDVNRDGRADLVTADYGDAISPGSITVRFGNGDGTFGAATTYESGVGPYGVWAADLNGDSYPDLVVTNYDEASLSIFINRKDGRFDRTSVIPNRWNLGAALADFDSDGDVDVVTCNFKENSLTRFTNDGTGALTWTRELPVGQNPRYVVPTVLDTDGRMDLAVVINGSSQVKLLANDGDSTFVDKATCVVGANPFSIATLDIDRNGALDVVTGNAGGGSITLLREIAPAGSNWNSIHARFPMKPLHDPSRQLAEFEPVRPNPSQIAPTAAFHLEKAATVDLRVFDLSGRMIRTLASRSFGVGDHAVVWDRADDAGRQVRPGLYFVRMRAAGVETTRTVVLAQ